MNAGMLRVAGSVVGVFAVLCGASALGVEDGAHAVGGDKVTAPVTLRLVVDKANSTQGVSLKAELRNQGAKPLKLSICTSGHMCCVHGLHVLVGGPGPGQCGLVDLCGAKESRPQDLLVPVKDVYATTIEIPAKHIPEAYRKSGARVAFQLCFELGNGELAESDLVTATLE